MKRQTLTLIFSILLLNNIFSQNGYVTWGNSFINSRTEWFLPNSPTNTDGNRRVVGWIKDSTMFYMGSQNIKFNVLSGSGERFVTTLSDGTLSSRSYYSVIDTTKLATRYFTNLTYQLKGEYISALDTVERWKPLSWQPDLTNYYTKAEINSLITPTPDLSLYVKYTDTSSMLSPYLSKVLANSMYQPIGNYLTSELDPTVPNYSKSLTNFSVIKASTDGLYEPIFSKNTAFNKSFGTTSGTVAAGDDSRIVNGQVAYSWGNHALSGYQTTTNMQNNLTASSTKYPTVDAVNAGMATKQVALISGTNIKTVNGTTILGSGDITTNQSLSLVGRTLTISGGNSVTLPSSEISVNYPSRVLNTNFDVLDNIFANYSVKILNGTVLISATSASVFLEYSVNGGSSWIIVSEVSREESGLSLISLTTRGATFTLSGTIPAGSLARIRTSIGSGSTVTLVRAQETKF